MVLLANPTPADHSEERGCGIGVNLNQAQGLDSAV
jgi:hypothetical protein